MMRAVKRRATFSIRVPAAERVLRARVCDLNLRFDRSRFAPLVKRLYRELAAAGIALRPRFYLSTEYGCITGSATIGLLWTDGFPFAQRLAKRAGIRTRDRRRILRTLRHEVGHAFCYAHHLYRTERFRRLFGVKGHFFNSYPEIWRPNAAGRNRLERGEVILLYATRHPDEDFAVCFEHWLERRHRWRRDFAGSPRVLEKLAYVEEVVALRGPVRPRLKWTPFDVPVDRVRATVADWMESVVRGTNYNLLPDTPVG